VKFKVGQQVTIIKHKVHYHGIIEQIDPILSSNFKRATGYWYLVKYIETVPYYCIRGEQGLFTNRDIKAS
jgi:heat shock protein HspQ